MVCRGKYMRVVKSMNGRANRRGLRLLAQLLACSAAGIISTAASPVWAQSSAGQSIYAFNIPAQPLATALAAFSRTTGISIVAGAQLPGGALSQPVNGSVSAAAGLDALLRGTGLNYRISGNTATIAGPASSAPASDGSILLEEVNVTAWFDSLGLTTEGVYETPSSVAHVDAATIDRFRGNSPADMFHGVPGVISADATSGAGSIDVNIRGMQGLGRVAVKVDGAENQVTLYQGYQGVSNRSFVDPDLIASIDIRKGPDVSSSGIAGAVSMRTVDASDIVKEGNTFGFKVKVGGASNSTKPVAGAKGGYQFTNILLGYPIVASSDEGMDRPSPLKPTQGSISLIGAIQTDAIDLIAGYAYRARGNYYAGTNGPSAEPKYLGETPFCYPNGSCPFKYYDYVVNGGLTNYRAGEEVLNTQLATSTFLTKATYRFGDGHSIKLGYTAYGSEAGDQVASLLGNDVSRPTQQAATSDVSLDTLTAQYKWNPAENELVNLTANLWGTWLEQRNPIRFKNWAHSTDEFGLPSDYKVGSDTAMWGADVTNSSVFSGTGFGPLTLTYGATYRHDDTKPAPYTNELEYIVSRDGSRQEVAAFAKASWDAQDWLTLDAGLRYSHFWSEDRSLPTGNADDEDHGQRLSLGGFSPSLGVTVKPMEGVQLFANYANVMRSPGLFESLTGFSTRFNSNLRPEHSSNFEIGTNLTKEGLFADGDRAMVKLAYFNQNVTDYIARQWKTDFDSETGLYQFQSMWVYNIDRANFSGIELSGRYEIGGFTAELGANYYLGVEFCQTAGTCEDKSLYADYATNQVPPLYTIDLTLSQALLEDKLTIGGRVSYVGPRAIGHGPTTAQGQSAFISLVNWEPYATVDVFADYKFTEELTGSLRVTNLTDAYYVDPLGLVQQPAPGRTISASITGHF